METRLNADAESELSINRNYPLTSRKKALHLAKATAPPPPSLAASSRIVLWILQFSSVKLVVKLLLIFFSSLDSPALGTGFVPCQLGFTDDHREGYFLPTPQPA